MVCLCFGGGAVLILIVLMVYLWRYTNQASNESIPPSNLAEEYYPLFRVIQSADSLFSLYEISKQISSSTDHHEVLTRQIQERESYLRSKTSPRFLTDNLELLDFRWEYKGNNIHGEARFRAYWLLSLHQPFKLPPGHSVRLILRGTPKFSHMHLLMDEEERVHGTFIVPLTFEPPLETWTLDTPYVVFIPKLAPLVPFQFRTFLIEKDQTKVIGKIGQVLDLGWYIDLPSEP